VCLDLWVGPGCVLEFGGLGGRLRGIETGADEIEDAAEGEVVANDLGELLGMNLRVVSAGGEIGYCEADFIDAEAGADAKPSLTTLLRACGEGR
jgi:hypothetical protein